MSQNGQRLVVFTVVAALVLLVALARATIRNAAIAATLTMAAPTQEPGPMASATPSPPTPTPTPEPTPTQAYPFLRGLGQRALEIFGVGQTLGNRRAVFSKVGDSITASRAFLAPIGEGRYDLRQHAYLAPVIEFYRREVARTDNSFANESLAAQVSWTTWSLLSPDAADRTECLEGENPLVCEYRLVRPSLALIMIGTNDVLQTEPQDFEGNFRALLDTTIRMGVVPIVSSLPPLNLPSAGDQVERFNSILSRLCTEYEIPFWDYWSTLVDLPDLGLSIDGVHPSEGSASADFTPANLQFGMTMRNLTALQTLDSIWRYLSE
ncbi:MAG TPA: SGNH/GDSL hydrolase family protein [Anaerolineales bacterium]|nr:SGNH/GDSL hydrolase family protein [Anaerolineales bacterium]